ncbi:hypothetical protein C0J52_04980 [Blattella germanica]|nr:hypothetical protein C0J52_04980 [Blattella germanica]
MVSSHEVWISGKIKGQTHETLKSLFYYRTTCLASFVQTVKPSNACCSSAWHSRALQPRGKAIFMYECCSTLVTHRYHQTTDLKHMIMTRPVHSYPIW